MQEIESVAKEIVEIINVPHIQLAWQDQPVMFFKTIITGAVGDKHECDCFTGYLNHADVALLVAINTNVNPFKAAANHYARIMINAYLRKHNFKVEDTHFTLKKNQPARLPLPLHPPDEVTLIQWYSS